MPKTNPKAAAERRSSNRASSSSTRRSSSRQKNRKFKNRASAYISSSAATSDDAVGIIPVTPQMIRLVVKELHSRKVYVSSSLIADHLRRVYPIDREALTKELEDKLEDTVCLGLIAKCGPDAYCLPTLRQQATKHKSDFTRFCEIYHKRLSRNSRASNASSNNTEKKPKKSSSSIDCSDNEDDYQ